jgi:hypothetical protein
MKVIITVLNWLVCLTLDNQGFFHPLKTYSAPSPLQLHCCAIHSMFFIIYGRGDKGLILTTGSFTREAKKEAVRDGATPIDLIDGNEFAERLKELNLVVEAEMVEDVKIKTDWFKKI